MASSDSVAMTVWTDLTSGFGFVIVTPMVRVAVESAPGWATAHVAEDSATWPFGEKEVMSE